jgi:hypothetical protein
MKTTVTDKEISFLLAQAVGWTTASIKFDRCLVYTGFYEDEVEFPSYLIGQAPLTVTGMRVFDYRDWSVIGPIAERYNTFPNQTTDGRWTTLGGRGYPTYNPQKSIALSTLHILK